MLWLESSYHLAVNSSRHEPDRGNDVMGQKKREKQRELEAGLMRVKAKFSQMYYIFIAPGLPHNSPPLWL